MAFEAARRKALATFRAASDSQPGVAASFLEGLASVVTRNVRLSARAVRLHLNVIDHASPTAAVLFHVTVTIDEIVSGATDSAWQPRFVTTSGASGADDEDRFQHRTLSMDGLSVHVYEGGANFAVGGGVAILDCNGDGRPDVFLAGGSSLRRSIAMTARLAARCGSPPFVIQ